MSYFKLQKSLRCFYSNEKNDYTYSTNSFSISYCNFKISISEACATKIYKYTDNE